MLEFNLQPVQADGRRLYLEAHGGDASNVVIAAARQGAGTAFLSAVGDDEAGRSFGELWRREQVDVCGIQVSSDHPTAVYFVSHDADGHHFSYLRRGSAASRYRLDETARSMVAQTRFVFASGVSVGISDQAADSVFEAMALTHQAGGQVAFDTNYRPKLWPAARASAVIRHAMSQADIAFPGLEDTTMLFGMTDPDAIADLYLRMGPKVVFLKMGSAGALVATPEGRRRIPPFPCRPVDATGAGDVFCGSVLARLAAGDDAESAGRYAACAAALATTGYGAVAPIPHREAVLAALEKTA